ncbi:hypothetical protein [Novosphingobium humi]|uniref:Uncharacterized protein n=1 Tax=Novosphingobium humi TaxID=2282397 RepID=A0ABY7U1L0_9SPHN|nr:hypothetical protein [Novosphingobium humi]WCT78641.1 hypothetical protein PQ457_06675 [Novosphingobium humi]
MTDEAMSTAEEKERYLQNLPIFLLSIMSHQMSINSQLLSLLLSSSAGETMNIPAIQSLSQEMKATSDLVFSHFDKTIEAIQ